jgi:cysteine desulfurase family protein (TIGR01976 family)
MSFDIDSLRDQFPALRSSMVFADGPAGTQVPERVIEAVSTAMVESVSNVGGPFPASERSGGVVDGARSALADLVGGRPDEIVFGPNMTTLTFAFSRAVAQSWLPGDRIVVSRLDHDANVTPWVRAAEDRGVAVDHWDIDPADVSLDTAALEAVVTERTRLIAVTGCSNAFGTLVDIPAVSRIAHAVGAHCFVDAVHMAPHRRIDVDALGCDALVCSAYKFFGPHVGVLWGRSEWLRSIDAYKVRPAPLEAPGKFETGTPSFPLLAGAAAAVDYLASLGEGPDRRSRLDGAYSAIAAHEAELGRRFLASVPPGVVVYGRPGLEGRVTTFAVDVEGMSAAEASARLGADGIATWPGHYYAVEPMRRLGLLDQGGLVRIGFVHINTVEEVDRVVESLSRLT